MIAQAVSSPVHRLLDIYYINIPQTEEAKTFFQGLQTERILKYLIFIQNGWIPPRFYGEKIKTIKKCVRDILSTISQAR